LLLTLLLSTTARSVGAGVTREDDTAQRRDVEAAPTKNRQYDCDAKGGRRAATMLALHDGIASSDLEDASLQLNLTLQSTRTPRQARPVAHGFVQATQRKTKLGSKLVAIYVFATYNKNPNTDGTCVIKTGDFAFGESPIPRTNPPNGTRNDTHTRPHTRLPTHAHAHAHPLPVLPTLQVAWNQTRSRL